MCVRPSRSMSPNHVPFFARGTFLTCVCCNLGIRGLGMASASVCIESKDHAPFRPVPLPIRVPLLWTRCFGTARHSNFCQPVNILLLAAPDGGAAGRSVIEDQSPIPEKARQRMRERKNGVSKKGLLGVAQSERVKGRPMVPNPMLPPMSKLRTMKRARLVASGNVLLSTRHNRARCRSSETGYGIYEVGSSGHGYKTPRGWSFG